MSIVGVFRRILIKYCMVPSRFMRKIVCRLRLSEVSRQRRRRPELPPSASCSCISCCPTGFLPRGVASRRPASGRNFRQGTSPPRASVGGSPGSAARSRCWCGCASSVHSENHNTSIFRLRSCWLRPLADCRETSTCCFLMQHLRVKREQYTKTYYISTD